MGNLPTSVARPNLTSDQIADLVLGLDLTLRTVNVSKVGVQRFARQDFHLHPLVMVCQVLDTVVKVPTFSSVLEPFAGTGETTILLHDYSVPNQFLILFLC
jgi:hypothetical protein